MNLDNTDKSLEKFKKILKNYEERQTKAKLEKYGLDMIENEELSFLNQKRRNSDVAPYERELPLNVENNVKKLIFRERSSLCSKNIFKEQLKMKLKINDLK
jgi:hypothetical protein